MTGGGVARCDVDSVSKSASVLSYERLLSRSSILRKLGESMVSVVEKGLVSVEVSMMWAAETEYVYWHGTCCVEKDTWKRARQQFLLQASWPHPFLSTLLAACGWTLRRALIGPLK